MISAKHVLNVFNDCFNANLMYWKGMDFSGITEIYRNSIRFKYVH